MAYAEPYVPGGAWPDGNSTIRNLYVDTFLGNLIHMFQQNESRLKSLVRYENDLSETLYFNRHDVIDDATQQNHTRHGDTPILDAPFSRRGVTVVDWEWGDMVDRQDKLRMNLAPEGDILKAAFASLMRRCDTILIAAMDQTAIDHTGTAQVALPAGQQVDAAGATALTWDKIRDVKNVFDENEAPEMERSWAIAAKQLNQDILNMDQFTNSDYNRTFEALREGRVPFWMGFNWVRTQLLTVAANIRTTFAFQKSAVGLKVNEDLYSYITPRADKKNNIQVYASTTLGGVRIIDEGVVECGCTEA